MADNYVPQELNRDQLHEKFKNREKPDEDDFKDLFKSCINKMEDQVHVKDHNIGIGTDDPKAKLHVDGTLMLKSGVPVDCISSDGTMTNPSNNTIPTQGALVTYVDSRTQIQTFVDSIFIGTIAAFASETIPDGWLICDGSVKTSKTYQRLSDQLKSRYGGDGTNTFGLPDLRGMFVRGHNTIGNNNVPSVNDPDFTARTDKNGFSDKIGSTQPHAIQKHGHNSSGLKVSETELNHNHYIEAMDNVAVVGNGVTIINNHTDRMVIGNHDGSFDNHGGNHLVSDGTLQFLNNNGVTTANQTTYTLTEEGYPGGANHTLQYMKTLPVWKNPSQTNGALVSGNTGDPGISDNNLSISETRPTNIALVYCIYAGAKA
jgi:microcystin-dependent protein